MLILWLVVQSPRVQVSWLCWSFCESRFSSGLSVLPPNSSTRLSLFSVLLDLVYLVYVEVFDPLWCEFCRRWWICIYLHSSTCRHSVIPAPFTEDALPFSLFLSKISVCRCVGLFLDLQFDSIDQPVCFYAITIQFLLLMLCSITWDQGWWYL